MHNLLRRQLKQATRSDGSVDLERLLALVGIAYEESDRNRHMADTALEALQNDLETRRRRMLTVAEARAQRAERQLLDAIEAISDAFALYDSDDRLVICNTQYLEILGRPPVNLTGLTFREVVTAAATLVPSEFTDEQKRVLIEQRIAEHGNPNGYSEMVQLATGRWMVAKEFRTPDGGTVGIRTDVTEIKKREAEIEALNRRYRLILDSAGDGIVGVDAQDIVTFANAAACRMLGIEPGSPEGTPVGDVLRGLDAVCSAAMPSEPGDGRSTHETIFQRCDGSSFVGEYVRAPLQKGDLVEGMVVVFRDVSLRKRYEEGIANHQRMLESQVAERTEKLSSEIKRRALTEQALMRSQGRLSGITSNLVEGVLLLDPYGHILFANRSAHRFLEAPAGQLPGTEIDDAMHLVVDGKPLDFQDTPWPDVIRTGHTVVDDDAMFVLPNGHKHFVAFACSPLEEDGKLRAAIVSFRSIEALKEAQRDSMQASRLASVGQLAAGIAHEINTPIQYIGDNLLFLADSLTALGEVCGGVKELVRDVDPSGATSGRLAEMFTRKEIDYLLEEMPLAARQSLEGVQHVTHIVRSMKDFSHPGTTAKVATDLNRAIDSVLTVSRNEWKQVAEVKTDLDATLPAIICFPADVNQMLLNLIINAAHAVEMGGKPGHIHISTHRDGVFVEIRVADNGPGVPQAIRERIFDPFFTTKPVGKGTGQGLAICFDVVVNKHGGKIYLDESVTDGATFVVRLPLGEGEP